jgi:uncharacterized protein (DUF1800 family)
MATRFGLGTIPSHQAPTVEEALAELDMSDVLAALYPISSTRHFLDLQTIDRQDKQALREGRSTSGRKIKRETQNALFKGLANTIARGLAAPIGVRDRLTFFWSDHFCVQASSLLTRATGPSFMDGAIRPHILAPFKDMLMAVATHPAMLQSLDQNKSINETSKAGQAGRGGRNENYAREILELHTLGAGGPYTQVDVENLSKLLTGLSMNAKGFTYKANFAQNEEIDVLGQTYKGGPKWAISKFFSDISVHPATALYVCTKMVRHFYTDPEYTHSEYQTRAKEIVTDLVKCWLDTDGDLNLVTRTLITHPHCQDPVLHKVKRPLDYILSGLRTLGVQPDDISHLRPKQVRENLHIPLVQMGQNLFAPPGPQGWPEDDASWISPPQLAARIQWALTASNIFKTHAPQKMVFAQNALGAHLSPEIQKSVRRAPSRRDALGLVLASPAFNRR